VSRLSVAATGVILKTMYATQPKQAVIQMERAVRRRITDW
jgi:hypothetical protein